MMLKESEILRCPECGGQVFHATAHVTQEWGLDQNGMFIRCLNDCIEVTHSQGIDDMWDCAACGYCGPGSEFIVCSKCQTCANRGTAWCGGCEHNFPGLEQFDFYQESKESGASDVCK